MSNGAARFPSPSRPKRAGPSLSPRRGDFYLSLGERSESRSDSG